MDDLLAPKPFYRSRLFWLGLPGLVFFAWLWLLCPSRSLSLGQGMVMGRILAFPEALEFDFVDGGGRFRWTMNVGRPGPFQRVNPLDPVCRFQRMSLSSSTTYTYGSMRRWIPISAYLVLWLTSMAGWRAVQVRRRKNLESSPP